jgi:hypothetical protein
VVAGGHRLSGYEFEDSFLVRKEHEALTARRATLAFLALLLAAWPFLAAAQDATPTTSSNAALDLAAMALAPEDVPEGYFDDYSELWMPAGPFSELTLGGEAVPPGLVRVYQSFYFDPVTVAAIHNYFYEFASPEEATAGSQIVNAALRPPLPEGTVVGPTHAPGPDLGDDPSVMTIVTYDTWAAGGPRADVVAATFRRDRLVAGVAVERYTDPPPAGTPIAEEVTPVAPDAAQEQLVTTLATTLDERITTVLAGQAPAGVDPALAALVLPLDQLADVPTPVFGGYKAGIDMMRCGICGEENTLLSFADDVRGGYVRGIVLGGAVDGEPQPPFVTVAVTAFTTPEAALAVLEAIRQTPNDRPTAVPFPRGQKTLVDDPAIPEATAALAFHATADEEDPNAPADAAGVDFVAGNRLVTVDVQGGLSAEDALAAAVDLASQQAACLAAGGTCGSVTAPSSLLGGPAAG